MKIRFESDDDLPLGTILSIPVCIIVVRSVFQEETTIIHKFIYMNVRMSMNINMKMILIPLYKCNFCTIYIAFALIIVFAFLFFRQNLFIHQLHKAPFIHQLHKVSLIYCFCFSFFQTKIQYSSFSMHQLHKVSFIHQLHKVSFI